MNEKTKERPKNRYYGIKNCTHDDFKNLLRINKKMDESLNSN